MPTYRVYIRRPLTLPPVWDWVQTVVAPSSRDAIMTSYENWVNTNPQPPVPPLSQCTAQANQLTNNFIKANGAILSDSGITPAQQIFINAVQQKVTEKLSTQLDGTFEVVNYPAGFHYGITYGSNAYYNSATLEDIDTLLGISSQGGLELTGGGFSGYYARLLPSVAFVFSQADQKTMNAQDTAASGQIASVISEFENAGGVFTNPLPFGGKLQDIFNQLTKAYGSLSNLPDTLNSLRNAIASYKSIAAISYALHNKYYSAMNYLNAALANATTASGSNGGLQTDATTWYPGYSSLPLANQLIGGLSTPGNSIEIDIAVSNFSSDQSQIVIDGKASLDIPIADIIDISIKASAYYDLSKYASSSTVVTMKVIYPGLTVFAPRPMNVSNDSTTGWYANDILQEVVANTGKDVTGYQLIGSEYNISDVFGVGKIFSRLKTFVISQQPTIEMVYTGSEISQIKSDLQLNASLNLDLFGLFSIGGLSAGYTVQKVDDKSVEGSVIFTFGPPNVSGTIPIQNQIAYIVGGVASYPPNNI